MNNKTGLLQVSFNNPVNTDFVLGYVNNEFNVNACTMVFMNGKTIFTFFFDPVDKSDSEAVKLRLEENYANC